MNDLLTALAAVFAFAVIPLLLVLLLVLLAGSAIAPAIVRALVSSSSPRAKWVSFAVLVLLQLTWLVCRGLPKVRGQMPDSSLFAPLDLLLVAAWVVLFASLYLYRRTPSRPPDQEK